MIAKWHGTCADCSTAIMPGDEIVVGNARPGTARKLVTHRWHGSKFDANRVVENLADSLASMLLAMEEHGSDYPEDQQFTVIVTAVESVLRQEFPATLDRWNDYAVGHEHWDGEPSFTAYGLLRFLMESVGRSTKVAA